MCANPGFDKWRRQAIGGLSGTVVEIGFGSGTNVALYPDEVTRVYAVEPSALARERSVARIESTIERRGVSHPLVVDHVGVDGESLPLPDASCDGALSTFTLCTIPDVRRALAEVHRVLRPGGRLHVLEHGASPDASVRRWQRRLEPAQRRFAGGCHLTRDVVELVEGAGFRLDHVEQRYVQGPRPWTWITIGHAMRVGHDESEA